jgi:aminoglycoside phosphotransferase (APT) family kinase protein
MAWQLSSPLRGLGDLSSIELVKLGLPSVESYLARYCQRRRLPAVTTSAWRFYGAFNLFRAAAIAQGIMGRAIAGNASSAHALEAGQQARALAELGWRNTLDCA